MEPPPSAPPGPGGCRAHPRHRPCIARFLFFTLLALLILSSLAAATDAKVWQQTPISEILPTDGPNAIAVVGDQLAVAFISGTHVRYSTYVPATNTWSTEDLPVEIPFQEYDDHSLHDIRLVDWDGRPAITWQGAYVAANWQYALTFAYRDTGGWHVERVTDRSEVGPIDLAIGPGSVPSIVTIEYSPNTPAEDRIALYHRTGTDAWVGEWVTGEDAGGDQPTLAFDYDLPRVAYTGGTGLMYTWKDAGGVWHPLEITTIADTNFHHLSLFFTSDHHPYITSYILNSNTDEEQYYGIYDNGNPTNPWTEDMPFAVGDGLSPDGVMEQRQDGDHLHVTYWDSRNNAIGYALRSPVMFGAGEQVAGNAWFGPARWGGSTAGFPATGPHITLFRGSPAVVYTQKVGTAAPQLVCSRLVDPIPTVTVLVPDQVRKGTLLKVFRVTGSGFQSTDTIIRMDGTPCDTSYVSPTELQFVELADRMATTGAWSYRVRTADGRRSASVNLTVFQPPAPTISSVNPASGPSGTTRTLSVVGTNFYGSTPEELQPGGDVDVVLTRPGFDAVQGTTVAWTATSISATFTLPAEGTWNVMVVNPDNQWEILTDGFAVTAPTGVLTVPGGAGIPTDTDGDGRYNDVNGNGRKDFADVVLYFNQMSWIAANEPVSLFDFNGNGRIDFADVVWLFNSL